MLLPPAVVGRCISVFFFCIDWAFSHCCFNNADLGIIMILFFIWTHCPWVLLFIHTYFRRQCVLSFSGGIIFCTSPSFSLRLHLLLPLHPLLLLLSLHLDLHPPITLAAFVQIVLINIYMDNLCPLNVI